MQKISVIISYTQSQALPWMLNMPDLLPLFIKKLKIPTQVFSPLLMLSLQQFQMVHRPFDKRGLKIKVKSSSFFRTDHLVMGRSLGRLNHLSNHLALQALASPNHVYNKHDHFDLIKTISSMTTCSVPCPVLQ